MFEIRWTSRELMWKETQNLFREIEGIEEIIQIQRELYGNDCEDVGFGDYQIDGLEYPPSHDRLTVHLLGSGEFHYKGKAADAVGFVIDFFEPEIYYFDIEFNTHWIDDVYIQRNPDGKNSITFGMGELDFCYSHAKVNRCWVQSWNRSITGQL